MINLSGHLISLQLFCWSSNCLCMYFSLCVMYFPHFQFYMYLFYLVCYILYADSLCFLYSWSGSVLGFWGFWIIYLDASVIFCSKFRGHSEWFVLNEDAYHSLHMLMDRYLYRIYDDSELIIEISHEWNK